ncbi:2-iminobutanoate/2-iminopropanoate deaminase [Deinobacterium chartae]|uniref:2-iminobutanoate/2-iminopropanoate deaminase n=1 Tax=Deinobacterium chartae TaxID=521158 RepID=A0A841I395_9DEIO|nr:RidA family protein [Deinobacterium chartae]MBB6098890.1 2-iminobutanoate/2-iminopropanoate deaminase [Deinobacterium chartae]
MRTPISTEQAPAAIGPYSQAVVYGDFVYTSGQIPLRPDGTLETGDIEAQTAQVFANLKAVLEAAGSGMDKVIKVTVFLKDMLLFARMNEVYARTFSEPYPARSTVEVARLPRDVAIEIEVVAHR